MVVLLCVLLSLVYRPNVTKTRIKCQTQWKQEKLWVGGITQLNKEHNAGFPVDEWNALNKVFKNIFLKREYFSASSHFKTEKGWRIQASSNLDLQNDRAFGRGGERAHDNHQFPLPEILKIYKLCRTRWAHGGQVEWTWLHGSLKVPGFPPSLELYDIWKTRMASLKLSSI